ncbi:hypothetical protein MTO96_046010 [Rhipicephalus appendiculatus]
MASNVIIPRPIHPEWTRLLQIFKGLDAAHDVFIEYRECRLSCRGRRGNYTRRCLVSNQKGHDENRNSAAERDSMLVENESPQTDEITKEEAENADGAICAENMFNDTAPGDDKECGDDEGVENVNGEVALWDDKGCGDDNGSGDDKGAENVSSEAAPGDDNECCDDEGEDKECGDDEGAENVSDGVVPGEVKECGDDEGAENVSDGAVPGEDKECGDNEGAENVSDGVVPGEVKECGDDEGAENVSDRAVPGEDKEAVSTRARRTSATSNTHK